MSFRDFKFNVDAGTVTVSRKLPNWNKNVISGPSMLCILILEIILQRYNNIKMIIIFESLIICIKQVVSDTQYKVW